MTNGTNPYESPSSVPLAVVDTVPRKLDLITLLLMLTADAVLFAGIRTLGLPVTVALWVVSFFTAIMLGQAVLFCGKRPRVASLLVGTVFFVIGFVSQNSPSSYLGNLRAHARWLWFVLAVFDIFCCYASGVLMGFVFVIADFMRNRYSRSRTVSSLR